MITESATRARVLATRYKHAMAPELLLAAAINAEGNIDLPAVRNGCVEPESRVEFSLKPTGEMVQRQNWISTTSIDGSPATIVIPGDQESMDMIFFAECLEHELGHLTPSLFRLTERQQGRRRQFVASDEEGDRGRMKLLHDAFSIHLIASAERVRRRRVEYGPP